MNVYTHTYMYIYIAGVQTYKTERLLRDVATYIYIYIYIYVYVYIYLCMYIHIHVYNIYTAGVRTYKTERLLRDAATVRGGFAPLCQQVQNGVCILSSTS